MTQSTSSRAHFDPSVPGTFSVDAIAANSPVALLQLVNASGPVISGVRFDIGHIRSIYTVGAAAAAARSRVNHNVNTIRRTAMFAETDAMTWLRPTVGLKRTFNPRIVRPQVSVINSQANIIQESTNSVSQQPPPSNQAVHSHVSILPSSTSQHSNQVNANIPAQSTQVTAPGQSDQQSGQPAVSAQATVANTGVSAQATVANTSGSQSKAQPASGGQGSGTPRSSRRV
ncbi:unknown [Cercopithecine alphaherpesvirus 9]|uniref:Small capsomere-interacting protein n=1 Tax=Cercopithecine herpesvirus 9 (strain DHV) TaxID=36348 RepID=Q9E1Z3_CHV9D|nr:small capsid protein [Cercopithecine alphaherpesvirus 9]AAG27196.1 unknown [Cercopithecine alphaherpesvirus 9]